MSGSLFAASLAFLVGAGLVGDAGHTWLALTMLPCAFLCIAASIWKIIE